MYRWMPNLSEKNVQPGVPWEIKDLDPVPEICRKDKSKRTAWALNPKTKYCVYSPYEGVNSSLRVSKDNPAVKLHAIVADYDIQISDDEADLAIKRLKTLPNWVERTLSGNLRLHWSLQSPLIFPSHTFAVCATEQFNLLAPIEQIGGLDASALKDPSRCFTAGDKWKKIHDVPISDDLIESWFFKVSKDYTWDSEWRVTIPIDQLKARLIEKYPEFNTWPTLDIGAQGPSLWIQGSTSPKSAIIREGGIQTFSAHAPKGFYSWAELLGADWVKQWESERIGRALKNLWFDGKTYWLKNDETWQDETKDGIINEFVVAHGFAVSARRGDRNGSEVDQAIHYIRNKKRVLGAGSFAFFKKGVQQFQGNWYLNTHTKDVLPPSALPGIWGDNGNFPWISKFLTQFFDPFEQLDYWLAWLSRFYGSCYVRDPLKGQNIFLAGPVNVGKTFLSYQIIGRLFNGHVDAKKYLMGESAFNSQLFDHALWCIDDGSIATSNQIHRYFSEMSKMIAANWEMESHGKFLKPTQVKWAGRLVVGCNDDSESLLMIPRQDISSKDKLHLFRAGKRTISFPTKYETEGLLGNELPYFARYLLDYVPRAHCLDADPRYGVVSYHEKSLVAAANLSDNAFSEILRRWMYEYFNSNEGKSSDYWEGSSVDLYAAMCGDFAISGLMKSFGVNEIKRALSPLSGGSMFDIKIVSDEQHGQKYKIGRGKQCPRTKLVETNLIGNGESKFKK